MRILSKVWCLAFLLAGIPAAAQHGGAPPTFTPPPEAKQFDFLVGEWEVLAEPFVAGLAARIHGSPKFPGTWKAWRGLDGWGIEDEVRLTDESGNPRGLTHSLRVYDAQARHWNLTSLDAYRARFTAATAEWRDTEMRLEGGGTDTEGRAYVTRTRFYDITPAAFKFQQDRSYDGGKTWTEGFLKMTAKRLAAAAAR